MNDELSNAWERLEQWVPAENLPSFHRVGCWLKTFRKSEEILRIFEATAVLGIIVRGAPDAIAKERQLLAGNLEEFRSLLIEAHRSRSNGEVDHLAKMDEERRRIAVLVQDIVLAGSEIQQALRSAADVDLDKMAAALHAKLEDRILDPAERIVARAGAVRRLVCSEGARFAYRGYSQRYYTRLLQPLCPDPGRMGQGKSQEIRRRN
jgi:hypothetical protein